MQGRLTYVPGLQHRIRAKQVLRNNQYGTSTGRNMNCHTANKRIKIYKIDLVDGWNSADIWEQP